VILGFLFLKEEVTSKVIISLIAVIIGIYVVKKGGKMKVVILAGGIGTRISEESDTQPKPMIKIGGMPVLLHIMKIYSYYKINEFIICLGYKGDVIKKFFSNYDSTPSLFCIRTN